MRRPMTTLVIVASLLGGCGFSDSNWNPFNWFGGGQPAPVNASDSNPLVPDTRRTRREADYVYQGTPIDTISELKIERIPGGAIIRATGVSQYQGGYNAFLYPMIATDGSTSDVLTFRFDISLPAGARAGGTTQSREITVARRVTEQDLAGIRTIRVEGRQNAQVSRR